MIARLATMLVVAVTLAAAPATASAGPIRYADTAFSWGLPTPAGDLVQSVAFSGARGYQVLGELPAQLLRTSDGGLTWDELANPAPLGGAQEVHAPSPATVVVAGCRVFRSADSGASFTRAPLAAGPGACARDVAFGSATVGYALLRDGSVARTADGGATFAARAPVPGVTSGTESASLAAFGPDLVLAVRDGLVYRSADGGGSWAAVASAPVSLTAVGFDPAGTAFAAGADSTVLRSADAGSSWQPRRMAGQPRAAISGLSCVAADTCLFPGGSTGTLHTTDGGDTVTATAPVRGATSAEGGRVVAIGARGLVTSGDLGRTFTSEPELPIGTLRPAGRTTVFSFGPASAGLARSTDAGRSWTVLRPGFAITSLWFSDARRGLALDDRGQLRVTADAGNTWTPRGPRRPSLTAAHALGRGVVLALTRSGGTLRSTDGGRRFRTVRSRALRAVRPTEIDASGRVATAVAGRRMAVSGDRGRTWRRVRLPAGLREPVVDFVTRRVAYAGQRDRLYATRDGGRRWRLLAGTGGAYVSGLHFVDGRHGFVDTSTPGGGDGDNYVDGTSSIARTDDGGRTFVPIPLPGTGLAGVQALDGRRLVVATSNGLVWSASGGRGARRTRITLRADRRVVRRLWRVRLTGTVSGTTGPVTLARLGPGGWTQVTRRPSSSGRFTFTARIGSSSRFVASVPADAAVGGAATPVVNVRVRGR